MPLREMLAQHRANPNCAACHARFDSLGLVFEKIWTGRGTPVETIWPAVRSMLSATFPGGSEGEGLQGVRQYIRDHRENDFVDNLCGKLLAYALGPQPDAFR